MKYNASYMVYRVRWFNFADQQVSTRLFAGKNAIYDLLHSGIRLYDNLPNKMEFTYYRLSSYKVSTFEL